jgi:hypothetical protein
MAAGRHVDVELPFRIGLAEICPAPVGDAYRHARHSAAVGRLEHLAFDRRGLPPAQVLDLTDDVRNVRERVCDRSARIAGPLPDSTIRARHMPLGRREPALSRPDLGHRLRHNRHGHRATRPASRRSHHRPASRQIARARRSSSSNWSRDQCETRCRIARSRSPSAEGRCLPRRNPRSGQEQRDTLHWSRDQCKIRQQASGRRRHIDRRRSRWRRRGCAESSSDATTGAHRSAASAAAGGQSDRRSRRSESQ